MCADSACCGFRWVAQKTTEDPDFFKRLASVHKPEYFFIGCADARYSVTPMLVSSGPEMFFRWLVQSMTQYNAAVLYSTVTLVAQ